jgi:hypothetical protein
VFGFAPLVLADGLGSNKTQLQPSTSRTIQRELVRRLFGPLFVLLRRRI